ncbi:hypothetical protein U1Q18_052635 [Sarracenia purpurea var. burkii]
MIQTQYSPTIKTIHFDLCGESFLTYFTDFLAAFDTTHQSSCFNTSAQNCKAERKYQWILNTIGSLPLSSSVPTIFWRQIVYPLNHMPNLLYGISPYEKLCCHVPDYSLLLVSSSVSFVLLKRECNRQSSISSLCLLRIKHSSKSVSVL